MLTFCPGVLMSKVYKLFPCLGTERKRQPDYAVRKNNITKIPLTKHMTVPINLCKLCRDTQSCCRLDLGKTLLY